MTIRQLPRLTAQHIEIDTAPDKFGFLESSIHLINDAPAMQQRMDEEGYLFLPGLLNRNEVLAARRTVANKLAALNLLDPSYDLMECVAAPDADVSFMRELAVDNPELMKVLYAGPMWNFFEKFFGEPALHFDYTWFRAVSPGHGTPAHMDVVYMGRGTKRLYTAWTPIGDVPLDMGGLLLLEHSHKYERLNNGYGAKDVDTFCENRVGTGFTKMGGGGNIRAGGALSNDLITLRERLGGRWLTSDYSAGDVLIFSVYTVHGSLDNHSNRIRLSSDSRYQRASEPADHRWMGANPIAHGPEGKRGMIC